ncbi:MAG TPA: hypothetical protein VKR56_14310 [Candidatus Cybelea sp.]|nr:hypothetical protein [Candidatus Cybelea sp.]
MIVTARTRAIVLSIAAAFAAGLIASCGGSPNTPNGPYVGSPGDPGGPGTHLVDVKVTVTVPARGSGLRPDYLSYNTQSLAIQLVSVNGDGVNGVNPTIMNTLPKSRDCKTQGKGTVCTSTAKGSPGSDVFSIIAYSGVGAAGDVLSVGTVAAKIAGNGSGIGISDQIPLTLDGVIASLKLSLIPDKAKRGEKTTARVSLRAYDASGAEIVGPSHYLEPISLQIEGDASKSFRLHSGPRSGRSLTIAKPTSEIALTYDGNDQASPVTVQAGVSGVSGATKSAGFNLTGKAPPPPVGTIYALNFGSKSGEAATVTEYDGKANGNAAPERTLSLDSKLYAVSLAVDSSGNIYVGYFDSANGATFGAPDSGNEIAVYAPGASGNDQPQYVLTADTASTSTAIYPIFLAFDPKGRLVTYGSTTVDGNTGDSVLTYAAGSKNATPPECAFSFQNPGLYYPGPSGLTVDSAGNVYLNGTFKNGFGSVYGMYVAAAADVCKASIQPARYLPWDNITGLDAGRTTGVALDTSAEPFIGYFVENGSGSGATCQAAANVYAAGAKGGETDKKPLRTLTLDGVLTQGKDCTNTFSPLRFYYPSIAMYAGATLFVADAFNNAISAYTASADGNLKPMLQIAGSATQLDAPVALAITKASGLAKAAPASGARAPEAPKHTPPLAKGTST